MLSFFTLRPWRVGAIVLFLSLVKWPATAQLLAPTVPGQSYNFMPLMLVEGPTKNFSKLLFSPAFSGRTEIQLKALNTFLPASQLEHLRRNGEVVASTLAEVSAAG